MSIPAGILFGLQAAASVAGAGLSVAAQMGQNAAQRQINEIQTKNAQKAAQDNYAALALMSEQETENAEQQIAENNMKAREATSTARVAAGEAGVSGLSVDALLRDLNGQRDRFNDGVTQNLERTHDQLQREAEGVNNQLSSQIASLTPISPVNYLGETLGAANGIFGAYKDHLKITERDV